ncbi:MAG: hypothetical protein ACJA0U_002234 [Salibacteraceae bacterium]|jgi:hypothetical protein
MILNTIAFGGNNLLKGYFVIDQLPREVTTNHGGSVNT